MMLAALEMEVQTVVSCLTWVLGTNFGLERQQVLLITEPPSKLQDNFESGSCSCE